MDQLIIDKQSIFLQGITLQATLTLSNPSEYFAISYQIEPENHRILLQNANAQTDLSKVLDIFPDSGIILKGETQKIRIRAKRTPNSQDSFILQNSTKITVKSTFDNNFNRILLKSNKFRSLSHQDLKNSERSTQINVQTGSDHIHIKDEIQQAVHLTASLGKQTNNISGIESEQTDQNDNQIVCQLINSLDLNSNIRQESKISPNNKNLSPNLKKETSKQVSSLLLESAKASSFSNMIKETNKSIRSQKINSFQLFIFAIVAGILFSLGSKFRLIINHL